MAVMAFAPWRRRHFVWTLFGGRRSALTTMSWAPNPVFVDTGQSLIVGVVDASVGFVTLL